MKIIGKQKATRISDTEIVSTNSGKWKDAMSRSEQILFESVAGDLLKTMGYKTEGITRRVSSLEQFMWKVHHLFWFVIRRLNTVNKKSWISSHFLMKWVSIRHHLKSVGFFSRFLRI